jgi:hypothetical protein
MKISIYIIYVTVMVALIAVAIVAAMLRSSRGKSTILHSEVQRLKMILELSEDVGRFGTWHLNIETMTVDWSSYVFDMHQRPHSNGNPTLGDAINYYHLDDRQMVDDAVRHAVDEGEDFEFRARIITEIGTQLPVLSRGTCQFDQRGRVVGVFGCFVDISVFEGR